MRTLLTYVLAALAAAIVLSTPKFFGLLTDAGQGDPRLAAGGFGAAIVGFGIDLLVAFNFFGLIWALATTVLSKLGREVRNAWHLLLGFAVFFLPPAVFFSITRALATQSDYGPEFIPVSDSGFLIAIASTFVAGLAWGTVFWLRAPKPQTAGIAA